MGIVFAFTGVPAKECTGPEVLDLGVAHLSKKVALHQERDMDPVLRKEGVPTCAVGPVTIDHQQEGRCHGKTALPSLPLTYYPVSGHLHLPGAT